MPLEQFEVLVNEGVEAIPDKFRMRIKNVAFLVGEEPTPLQRKQNGLHTDETLLGLYEGIPHPARGVEYGNLVMPDRITIFKRPIEAKARLLVQEGFSNSVRPHTIAKPEELFRDEVRRLVLDTVWHEVAHHFGLDEEGVERREQERSEGQSH